MEPDKSILLQKQVRDNSEDLQSEFLDMKNWEAQMKRKDSELRNAAGDQVLPPIRTKKKKPAKKPDSKGDDKEVGSKRIRSYDYTAWDKFDVDKACEDIEKQDQSGESCDEEMSREELERNHQEATKHKERGNLLVKQKQWDQAVHSYSEAIRVFSYDAVFYANRALCYLKMDNLYSAEADCTTAIQLDERYVKAYHRRATARMALKQYQEAKQDLEKLLILEPSNKDASTMLAQVKKKLERTKPVIITEEDLADETPIEKKIGEKLWSGLVKKPEEPLKNNSKSDNRIPRWVQGEEEDVVIVNPITKPPHQRSKKPLKRITVAEIDFGQTEPIVHDSEKPKDTNLKETEITTKGISTENSSNQKQQDICSRLEDKSTTDKIPPIPKTSVQFLMNWRKNKSMDFRYKYLKQLPAGSIHTIFQDSMESDTFSDILKVLGSEFVRRNEQIFPYLEDLSQVKRFGALTMFMSSADKKDLNSIFESCEKSEERSREELIRLRNKYEI